MLVTKQAKNQNGTQEKQEIPLNLPESCLACRTLNVATFPVYLTEMDGRISQAGHVARCTNCGHIKSYGAFNGIGRFDGKNLHQDFHKWEVLKRNGISGDEWIEAVLEASRNPWRMIWLDARNGLLPAEPEGKYAEILKRWEGVINGRGKF